MHRESSLSFYFGSLEYNVELETFNKLFLRVDLDQQYNVLYVYLYCTTSLCCVVPSQESRIKSQ
jgi:hypothetical protein